MLRKIDTKHHLLSAKKQAEKMLANTENNEAKRVYGLWLRRTNEKLHKTHGVKK